MFTKKVLVLEFALLVMILASLCVMANSASAQAAQPFYRDAKQAYEQLSAAGHLQQPSVLPAEQEGHSREFVVNRSRASRADSSARVLARRNADGTLEAAEAVNAVAAAPGENVVFVARASHEFVQPGQELGVDLLVPKSNCNGFSIYGYALKPGQNGAYDGTQPVSYFYPEIGPYGNGWFPNGVEVGATYMGAYTRKYTNEDPQGEYILGFFITDSRGILLQQFFVYAYLRHSAPYSRWWKISQVTKGPRGLVISGSFPQGVPLQMFLGNPRYFWAIGDAISNDGKTIEFGTFSGIPYDVGMDVSILIPSQRLTVHKPQAFVLEKDQ